MFTKRMIIATIMGVVSGIVCWRLSTSGGQVMHWSIATSTVLGRVLLGFGIGISAWKLAWWLHGLVLGVIFSIPMAFSSLMAPEQALFVFIGTIVMGAIYGIVIELVGDYSQGSWTVRTGGKAAARGSGFIRGNRRTV